MSIGAALVASDVLNMENQFLHFLSVTAEIGKGQLVESLTVAAISLLFGGIITVFAYRYFTAEPKEGTPFTNTGTDRIKQLGIMEIVQEYFKVFCRFMNAIFQIVIVCPDQ